MQSDSPQDTVRTYSKGLVYAALAILLLIVAWILVDYMLDKKNDDELGRSNLDLIANVIREESNRIEVQTISGKITTVRETQGGPFGIFDGKLVIRQPFSVSYFVDMRRMNLSDYIWDKESKTLFVRLPEVVPDPPNIDASKQETQAKGWVITRKMQERLRAQIATGAKRQAQEEAMKPEHMNAATEAARKAIDKNLSPPLRAAGIEGVRVEVLGRARNTERWDVSRSIAEVLAESAGR